MTPHPSPVGTVDLRSDTVTLPSPGMRAAMAAAEVGDDQFGEDPTVNRLQARVAELLGKSRALWMPSGTMANQVALRVLTRPGDDVIVARESHTAWSETGGGAANSGVQLTEIGEAGVFDGADLAVAAKPRGHPLLPPTTLVEVENTHNRAGGVVFPAAAAEAVSAVARERGIATYLDGARLWNASAASGEAPAALAAPFDLVSVAFSKGLGAPGGSILAGPEDLVSAAVRHRRMLGGAMRQVGILAAAADYALDHHLTGLLDDHAAAAALAVPIAREPGVVMGPVETNIVVFHLTDDAPDAATVVERARIRGVLVLAFGPRTIRAVTHRDVTFEQCRWAGGILAEAVTARSGPPADLP